MSKEKQREQRWRECDFYAVLGLEPSASQAEVKKGFRRVALSCHPDKVAADAREEATTRFQRIAEAYEVLSDPKLRREYDALHPSFAAASRASSKEEPREARRGGGGDRPGQQRQQPKKAMNPDRGGGPGNGLPRCEGCDVPTRSSELRRCPQCSKRICTRCDLCASCIPEDCDARNAAGRYRRGGSNFADADEPTDPYGGYGPSKASTSESSRQRRGHAEVWERSARAGGPEPSTDDVDSDSSGEVYCRRPLGEESDSDDDHEARRLKNILLAMGFSELDVNIALRERPSLTAAVEFLMNRGERAAGGIQQAATGLYGVAEHVYGEQVQPAACGFYGSVIQPGARTMDEVGRSIAEAVSSLGSRFQLAFLERVGADGVDCGPRPKEHRCSGAGGSTAIPSDKASQPLQRGSRASAQSPPRQRRGGPRLRSTLASAAAQRPAPAPGSAEAVLLAMHYSREEVEAARQAGKCTTVKEAQQWIHNNPYVVHPYADH